MQIRIIEGIKREILGSCNSKYFYGNYKNNIDNLVRTVTLVDEVRFADGRVFVFTSDYFWNLYLLESSIDTRIK